ncbi:transglycosylase SLT domain-containing protein [uncultured Prevotella sp.]|uniref:transglycosylase SLT domain-containing protein n=1 Tax=uncultured Prevotella sp. TaxID=159272 RepID=UPI0026157713|nr:transglycosylase SLT domain-containing protein [uncultured Prevotella sp.]
MERILRKVFVFLFVFIANSYAVAENSETKSSQFDWNPVMDAIIQVESEGNPKAVSGNSCGAMQITPILVKECNNILRKKKSKKRFKLSDRFNVAKSKEMFILFQSAYNPKNSIEQAIRSWNGGLKYSVRGTQKYFNKVMKLLK